MMRYPVSGKRPMRIKKRIRRPCVDQPRCNVRRTAQKIPSIFRLDPLDHVTGNECVVDRWQLAINSPARVNIVEESLRLPHFDMRSYMNMGQISIFFHDELWPKISE